MESGLSPEKIMIPFLKGHSVLACLLCTRKAERFTFPFCFLGSGSKLFYYFYLLSVNWHLKLLQLTLNLFITIFCFLQFLHFSRMIRSAPGAVCWMMMARRILQKYISWTFITFNNNLIICVCIILRTSISSHKNMNFRILMAVKLRWCRAF